MDESVTRFRLHCDTCLDEEIFSVSSAGYDGVFHQDGRPRASGLTVLTKGWKMDSPAGSSAVLYTCPACDRRRTDEATEEAGREAEPPRPEGEPDPGPVPVLPTRKPRAGRAKG